jgi:selenocysteine lyase/cysteine desulfurase
MNVLDLRDQFPYAREIVYFNTGTVGLCPLPVVEALLEQTRALEIQGQSGWGPAAAVMEEARARLAVRLGTTPESLTFTQNATDGTNYVAAGIDWQPEECGGPPEVLLSGEEHPSMELPWHYLQQLGRIRLNRFRVSADPEETLAAAERALTPRTRLLATSHVFSHSGNRAPVERLAALCRERGVLLHLDGAQSVGQFGLDLMKLGADFYTANCHKWLLGPKGTGFLYVRPESRDRLRPVFVGAGSASHFAPAPEEPTGPPRLSFPESERRFEYGTRDFARYAALVALMDWWDSLGQEAAEARLRELSGHLRARLLEVPGIRFHTNPAWEHASAMTTLSLPGKTASELCTRLWEEHRILTRHVGEWEATRLSTALYNTEEEIDRTVTALRAIAG